MEGASKDCGTFHATNSRIHAKKSIIKLMQKLSKNSKIAHVKPAEISITNLYRCNLLASHALRFKIIAEGLVEFRGQFYDEVTLNRADFSYCAKL